MRRCYADVTPMLSVLSALIKLLPHLSQFRLNLTQAFTKPAGLLIEEYKMLITIGLCLTD